MPRIAIRWPADKCAPSFGVTISERTSMRLIGTMRPGVLPGSTHPQALSGMRYAFRTQKPSNSLSRTVTSDKCFTQYVAYQPGTISLAGKPLEHRQRLAVHLVGNHHRGVLHDSRDREAFHEIRNAGQRRLIQSVETHVDAGLPGPCGGQDVAQPHARPLGIAHRAVRPLSAENARREIAAAVSRTLVHRHDTRPRKFALQIVEREFQRPIDRARHLKPPFRK